MARITGGAMAMSTRTPTNQNWMPRVSTAPAMCTGMVRVSSEPMVRANRNSFQVNAMAISIAAAMLGIVSLKEILRKMSR